MSSIYLVHKWPKNKTYFIRVKDKEKSIDLSTNILLTRNDIKKIEDKRAGIIKICKLAGNEFTKERVLELSMQMKVASPFLHTHKRIKSDMTISEAFNIFKEEMSNPQDMVKRPLAKSTINNYEMSIQHLINAVGDIAVVNLKPYMNGKGEHYNMLRKYFGVRLNKDEVPGNALGKVYTDTTFGINLRQINSVLNYIKKRDNLNVANAFPHLKSGVVKKEIIPHQDMQIILDVLFATNKRYFAFVYFLYLTGCRQSTAIVQDFAGIDNDSRIISLTNIKCKHRKYNLVMYDELYNFCQKMTCKNMTSSTRLFYDFPFTETCYSHTSKFWYSHFMPFLVGNGLISKKYELKSIRESFVTFITQQAGIDLIVAKILVDHDFSKDITIEHYYNAYNPVFREYLNSKFKSVKFWQNNHLLEGISSLEDTRENSDEFKSRLQKYLSELNNKQ